MMFKSLALLTLIVGASATVHTVQVGGSNGELAFSPDALSAAIGDQVVFHFNPKNHSVVQSAFANPCGPSDGGLRSQFYFVEANSSVDSRPTFSVNVTTLSPTWFYCAQAANTPASHCGAGMVFAVNCPTDPTAPNTFANFKKAALAVGASLSAAAATPTATGNDAGAPTVTGANGAQITLPAVVAGSVITVPISLNPTSVWTTTYTSFENSPAATPVANGAGTVHTVIVGGANANLTFSPNHIIANPRDQIVFQFEQKNHSVVQSSFASPCTPLNALNATAPQALRSGFQFVDTNTTSNFPTWTVTVNDTTPAWFYCEQTAPKSHCGAGMVFSVNAIDNTTRNFAAFQSLAEELNGTGAASASTPAPTTGAAVSVRANGAVGVVFALVAIAASLL